MPIPSSMLRKRGPLLVWVALMLSSAAARADLQGAPWDPHRRDESLGSSHTLRGHVFLPPTLEPSEATAFVMSYFGIRADGANVDSGGLPTAKGVRPLYTQSMTLTLDLAASLNSWVGLYGSF